MKIITTIALLLSLASSAALSQPSAQNKPLDKVDFRLDWSLSGFHLPFYWAAKKGYYKDEGLDVEIKPGGGSQQTINLVAGGHDEVGFADLSLLASSFSKGMKVKAIYGVVQRDAWSIYSRPGNPIRTPADLAGKSLVAVADHKPMLDVLMRLNKVDPSSVQIRIVNPQTRQTVFAQGAVDSVLGVTMSALPTLGGGDIVSMTIGDYGVKLLGQGIIASENFVTKRPDVAKRFLRATTKALQETAQAQNIDEAVSIATSMTDTSLVSPAIVKEQWTKTIPLLKSTTEPNRPYGWMSATDWADTINTLRSAGRITGEVDTTAIFTNDFNVKN